MVIQIISQIVCKELGNSKDINNDQHGFVRNKLSNEIFFHGSTARFVVRIEKHTGFKFWLSLPFLLFQMTVL